MSSVYRNALRMFAVIMLLAGAVAVAQADDDEHEGGRRASVSNAKWQAECGSCHVAFPPRMLPAASWREMMSGLGKHFGTDASLEAPVALEIGAFLEKNAGTGKQEPTAKPQLRISETRWFVREHDEVPERVWKNPLVKSPANCAACHTRAESGDYRERNIRMPE
ncbi:MAG: diheme cytochrome c [Nitrosomonadales bacterium]|nr:diheme cytochrome c [Nitrosomonadales bacterium]